MSRNTSTARPIWRALLLVLATALLPAAAQAQATGRIAGTVTDDASAPVQGAQVSVAGTRLGTLTDAAGRFVLVGVPVGAHQLQVQFTGYRAVTQPVTVQAGEATSVSVRLEGEAIQLGGIVISASRRAERVTEAPATVTRVDPEVIGNSPGSNWTGALREVKGLDYIQVGVTSVAINARGFNSSFNNRMLMIEDGRIAVLPENGLPVGQFTAIPKVDLAGIEVLVGPGAALYGADASSGVVTLQSKDPREYPGTTVEVTGGSREYKDVQARHAGVAGRWGYKVAGEWQSADDWSNRLQYPLGKVMLDETGVGGAVNWDASVVRGHGALFYYLDQGQVEVSAGASQTDGVGQTNIGRNQLDDWQYNFVQAKATFPRWFFNLYRAQSQSGKSYALNRFTPSRALLKDKTDEEIRLLSDWPSDGRLYAAELQNNFTVPALLNTSVIWGAQYRRDVVSSDREWLMDRFLDKDLEIGQTGVYAQTETPLAGWVNLVLAGRYDKHDNYDPQFSPKAGIVVKPAPDQAVRLTYNRAFKSPTILQTNFYIPDFIPGIGVFGNTGGYTVQTADGAVLATYGALVPEENQTWELGYKGVLAKRLFVDVTGYRSNYNNFLSPLQLVNFPALGSFLHDADGKVVAGETGKPQAGLIYFNLGDAELVGADAGFNYLLSRKVSLKGTFSWVDLKSIEGVDIKNFLGKPDTAKVTELSSLNAPNTKWTLGASFADVGRLGGAVTLRHVDEYFFASGINKGTIPTFTTLDANVGYRLPWYNTQLNVGVSNLFTCRGSSDASPEGEGCGFGKRHLEMINMPEIGTMLFVGVRYHVQ